MIRALYVLGQSIRELLGNDPHAVVEQLALTTPDEELDEERERTRQGVSYIGIFDLCPSERTLRYHVVEVSPENLRKYLWLQLMKFAPGKPVRDVTVRDLRHLLGPVFVGLAPRAFGLGAQQPAELDALEPVLQPALPLLRDLREDFDDEVSTRDAFLLNLDGFRLDPVPNHTVESDFLSVRNGIICMLKPSEGSYSDKSEKLTHKEYIKLVTKALLEALGWKKDVQYVTLSIEGRVIATEPAYRAFALNVVLEEPFGEARQGCCHLCGEEKQVTSNFTPLRIKVFINDKVSFAGGIQKSGFFERYSVCRDCYTCLLIADRLLEQELEIRLLQTPVFLIPELLRQPSAGLEGVRQILQEIRREATELGRITKLRKTLADLTRVTQERAARYATLTLLFHEKQNMAVKIREVVAEVPPSRVQRVIVAISRINDAAEPGGWAEPLAGRADSAWFSGLNDLLQTLPIRRSKGGPVIRPALTLTRQLLQQEPIDLTALHAAFLEGVRAIRSVHAGYWIVPQRWADRSPSSEEVDRAMRAYLARTLALRLITREVGCTTFGGDPVGVLVPDPYRTAMQELGLSEQEQSLFLLGVLLARVASEQYRSDESKTKPVLEKLNYTGMSLPRVTSFASELFDKLRQYRLLSGGRAAENELLFAEAVQQLTRHRSRWSLTDAENVYFLLAGYAYETGAIIRLGREKSPVEAQQAKQSQ